MNQAIDMTPPDSASTVEFAEVRIGDRFATDRWIWEKIDTENAKALDQIADGKNTLQGQVLHFRSWSQVHRLN